MEGTDSGRRILTAELLSIGSELTVGETRDTNAGELARSLTEAGVMVGRLTTAPDRLETIAEVLGAALARADLVVSTGGLGPTPDDLTREAIAEVMRETPSIDADLEAWLRALWARRGIPFPEMNLKQAWLIPSAVALPNPNGTAPGWLVTRGDGRLVVALPGPPREMRPMWRDEVVPRLRARGLGADIMARTYRLTGIGESQVAQILGEEILRATDPEVATYARAEAVDVRISAVGAPDDAGTVRSAQERVAAAAAIVEDRLGRYVWATGGTTWAEAIGARLERQGWRLAVAEFGTGGSLGALLGGAEWLLLDESTHTDAPGHAAPLRHARAIARRASAEVGMTVVARERDGDTRVSVAIVTPDGHARERHTAFLGGVQGRSRAALLAAAALDRALRRDEASVT